MSLAEDYFTPDELLDEFERLFGERPSPKWLQRHHANGTGPARTKIGKRIVYRRSAVQKWLRQHEHEPPRSRRRRREAA